MQRSNIEVRIHRANHPKPGFEDRDDDCRISVWAHSSLPLIPSVFTISRHECAAVCVSRRTAVHGKSGSPEHQSHFFPLLRTTDRADRFLEADKRHGNDDEAWSNRHKAQ
ncbi:MAG: hypothetical protein ACJ8J7_12195 [Sulfurifustaceae bacterium]